MNLVFPPSGDWRALLTLLLAPAVSFSAELVQKAPPTPPHDANSPVLIWDISHELDNRLPRNFRTTDDPLKAENGKIPANTGLVDLHASGGGEFSAKGLKLLLKRTRGPVTVFDLRQETHIFVNGLPVSWFATNDWANVGRTHTAIELDETEHVKALTPGSKIVVAQDDVKKSGLASGAPEHVVVKQASTERNLVESNNLAYARLTVTDHARPLDEEVDRFIQAVRELPKDGWAHFHCEAGRGRTTTFMVLYDMLRNANQVALEDIAGRQKLLGYNYDVLRPAESGDWKAPYTDDRIAFVRAFYRYARANPGGRPQLWSEWLNAGG
jgi:hypothetical protein